MAACTDLPRKPVTVQPCTMSLHLPTVAAWLAVVDPEVRPLEGKPGFRLTQGMEVKSVRLPIPMTQSLVEGLCFTRGDGADLCTAVHRRLPSSSRRPPGYDLVGVEWRLWGANSPCPPVVMWPRRSGPSPVRRPLWSCGVG